MRRSLKRQYTEKVALTIKMLVIRQKKKSSYQHFLENR
jgi:hypothetical protein